MSSAAHEGALFLDERRPGWEKEIDVERLNMRSTKSCVLGQLLGSYGQGLEQLNLLAHADGKRLGFLAPSRRLPWIRDPDKALAKAWKKEIANRQVA